MTKATYTSVKLSKGEIVIYNFGDIKLYAYKTNDFIDDECFILTKNNRGIVIELPCFFDNIAELTDYLKSEGIEITAKIVAYHCAGATFLPNVPAYGTKTSVEYNSIGGGAGLVNKFKGAFGEIFDPSVCTPDNIIEDGEIEIGGIKMIISSTAEAFDIEFPQINSVYTHMMGHDCHSIVAGCPHADSIISQLKNYISRGFDLILSSHYTPEDLKDAQTKIDYLSNLKEIALDCKNAEEMKEKINAEYPEYSGMNYLDMTVGFFFPAE